LNRLQSNYGDDISTLVQIGTLLESVNEREKALKIYKQVLNLDPENITANKKLATWNRNAKTESEFLASLLKLISNENIPKDEKIRELIPYVSRLKPESEMLEIMLNHLNILQEMYPNDARVNALHGDVYFNSNQPEESIPFYQTTIDQDKSIFLVWKNLMMAQDNSLDFKGLRSTAINAIDYFPNQAVCFYYAGKAEVELGNLDEAKDWLQEGQFMVGNNKTLKAEFFLLISYLELLQSKNEAAATTFSKVESQYLGPRHAFYFEVKGDLEFEQGKISEALKSWEQSIYNGGREIRIGKKIEKARNS